MYAKELLQVSFYRRLRGWRPYRHIAHLVFCEMLHVRLPLLLLRWEEIQKQAG
jgi:hypothetical protein